MAARERERERDRRNVAATPRTNEYFVPKDGIDREVITADICRYLGNDALVRPGKYENPSTRTVQEGYFITAYRNLTTAMIADLKADSARWEDERRATASRGQPANVGYRDSQTHSSRQYYGPTEPQGGGAPGYASNASPGPQGVYDSGPSYSQNYGAPAPGYNQQPGYAMQSENYYVAGADLRTDQTGARVAVPQSGINVPRSNVSTVQYSGAPSYQQPDRQNTYYSGQVNPQVSSAQYPPSQQQQQQQQQPSADPYYGRAAPVTDTMYSPPDAYNDPRGYQDNGSYSSQAPMPASTPAVAPNISTRRERERDPEPRDRHRNNRR